MINIYDAISRRPQYFKQLKVNDLLFVEYNCIIEETKKGLWTHKNAFFHVLKGKKKWITTKREYEVYAGDTLFVKKGAYIAQQYFGVDFCALIIFLPDDFIRQAILDNQINCPDEVYHGDTIIPVTLNEILSTYFQSIIQYFTKSNPPPTNLLELKFQELIFNIFFESRNKALCSYFKALCNSSETSIREIMEANFAYEMSLNDYARLCGRSLSSFKRDFEKLYGTTPGRWLTEKRLEYGKFLLETTDKDITEITFACGYQNPSHFNKIFKSQYGMPPLKYRNTHIY